MRQIDSTWSAMHVLLLARVKLIKVLRFNERGRERERGEGEGGAREDPLSLEISRDPVSFRLPFAFRGSIRFHVHVNEAGMSLLPGGLIKFQGVITRSV